MPKVPLIYGTGAIPGGEVSRMELESLISRVLDRPVGKNDILNVKIKRVGSEDSNRHTIEIGPSGSEGPRNSRNWTFPDFLRLVMILSVTDSTPRIRAYTWVGLSDAVVGGLVDHVRSTYAAAINNPRWEHVPAEMEHVPEHAAEIYSDVVSGESSGAFLQIPLDESAQGHGLFPAAWDDCQPWRASVILNLVSLPAKALFCWDHRED